MFDQFWTSPLSQDVSSFIKDVPENTTSQNQFDKLHEYACNPDNFWPQIRERITTLPTTFNSIKTSGRLVWLDDVQFISDNPGKNDDNSGLSGGGISTDALIHLIKNATIPVGGSLVVIGGNQKVVLEATDEIRVETSASNSGDAFLSYIEQT